MSEGTLRSADLLDTFARELEHLVQRNAVAWCSDAGRKERDRYMALIGEARECIEDHEAEIVDELIDALQDFAPRYAMFGARAGDGASFGFWLDVAHARARIQEDGLLVTDASEVPNDYRGEVLLIDDHGGAILFDASPPAKLVEVWAVI